MSSKAIFSRIHSHLLGITLIAGGVSVHAAEPYVRNSIENLASSPRVLAVRANYLLAVGDIDSALRVAKKAAQPTKAPLVERACANHM